MYFLTKKLSDKDASEIQRMIPRRDFVNKWKHLEKTRTIWPRSLPAKRRDQFRRMEDSDPSLAGEYCFP